MIIILVFSLIALPEERSFSFPCMRGKKANAIKFVYRKSGTQQKCFPKHLHRGTVKIKEDAESEEEHKKKKMKM